MSELRRNQLKKKYELRYTLLQNLVSNLENEIRVALLDLPNIDRVSFRVKGVESFISKALDPKNKPKYQDPLAEIEDQVGGRIIVFYLSDINTITEKIHEHFTTVESLQRRPQKAEEFGYESHHIICIIPPQVKPKGWETYSDLPKTFEIQIRTIFMHAWAEPNHNLGYKPGEAIPNEVKKELAWIAASAWGSDQALERVNKKLICDKI